MIIYEEQAWEVHNPDRPEDWHLYRWNFSRLWCAMGFYIEIGGCFSLLESD